MKDKLERKKYMGVCRCEFSAINIINPKFPSTVTIHIPRNRKNRGSWRSSQSANHNRMNLVTKETLPGIHSAYRYKVGYT